MIARTEKIMLDRYVVRKAAGANWLIDMHQIDGEYKNPVYINDSAAFIIAHIKSGSSRVDTAQLISDAYGADKEKVLADIDELLASLGE